jgi:orotate phosphoribosyltransferase
VSTRDKSKLIEVIKRGLEFGQFDLASGQSSSYYIDAKIGILSPDGYPLVGRLFADALKEIQFDAVGGSETGAIPIACAVAAVRYTTVFFVRRKSKEHGTKKWIEGPLAKGNKVVIVDDVVTTGMSVVHAIKHVKDFGADVVKVIVLVDRLAGASERILTECGNSYGYEAILTMRDLGVGLDESDSTSKKDLKERLVSGQSL